MIPCDPALDPSWKYRIQGYCEDAQEDCCREECDKGKKVMSSSCGLENVCSGSKLHALAKVFQSFVPPKCCGTKWMKTTSSSRVVSTNHLNVLRVLSFWSVGVPML
ncbi:hypothetical protein P3L10_008426 [Capsicum annuum]